MDGLCSCGTTLVDDASFCHRCGKATRELLVKDKEEESPEPKPVIAIPPAPPAILPVSFGNAVAVRVGFLAASVASMLDALPWVDILFLLWSVLAGYFSVILYRKRTGQTLTIRSGAKMGGITGVLNAVIVIVFFTLTFVATISDFTSVYHQQLTALQAKDPASYARASGFLESPYALATGVIFLLMMLFVTFSLAGVAGGALSAKFAKKE